MIYVKFATNKFVENDSQEIFDGNFDENDPGKFATKESEESKKRKFPIKEWEKAKMKEKILDQGSEENRTNMQKGLQTNNI